MVAPRNGPSMGHGPPQSTFGLQRLTPKQLEPEPQEKLPPSSTLPPQLSLAITSRTTPLDSPTRSVLRCAIPQNGEYIPRFHRSHSLPLCAQGTPRLSLWLSRSTVRAAWKSRRSSRSAAHGLCENPQQQTETPTAKKSSTPASLTSRDCREPDTAPPRPLLQPRFSPYPPTRPKFGPWQRPHLP
ncbi:hypothetical protein B0T18DRAFT_153497 [Schizothecium vesticola]|uniref:Uncharacterized protein n=1 Tax=Schizothecium vesticola TaxID=314040 RepID=A0AA40K5R0_9PEZI|nr:hypothetical protein B0T18DRAFT_153497 [Schizothecium vesticola]